MFKHKSPVKLNCSKSRFAKFAVARRIRQYARLGAFALWVALVGPAYAQVDAQVDANPGVDTQVKPGDDFFAYANGAWLKGTPIPEGKDRVTARSELVDLVQPRVASLMVDGRTQPAGSLARKVADFRLAYLNQTAIDAAGLTPIRPVLNQIDRLHNKAALTRFLGRQLRSDVDPVNQGIYNSAHVLGMSVEAGLNAEKTYVAFLTQGGLGLQSRDDYLSAEPAKLALRAAYQTYIAQMLANMSKGSASALSNRAKAVIALETALAQSHANADDSGQDSNANNLWTRADFANRAPGMNWAAFFDAAGLAKQQTFVAWQPGAVQGLAALVEATALPVWSDYLRFHALHRHADVLPAGFAGPWAAFRASQGLPAPQAEPRARQATTRALGEALGRLYVERFFAANSKAQLQTMATNVIAALDKRVDAVAWMSASAKAMAHAKLKSVYFGLGYPESWRNYAALHVNPNDPVGNLQRVAQHDYQRALARLGQPVDRRAWSMNAHTVGALLMFQQNAYNFPAALLQTPKFDPAASDAANYGAIGAIIGHEVSHTIDSLGMDYDARGALRNWWTADDKAQYDKATHPLVAQYDSYQALPGLAVNGKSGIVENLADLGGLAAAFDAHRAALADKGLSQEAMRLQDQQFFIGFARSWRSKFTDEAMRKLIATDNHAPDKFRIATVRNIDAWYDAFNVQPGQRLYLEPKARLKIW